MKTRILILSLLIGSYVIIASLFSSTICLFKNITGIPCPGCGLTRAYLALFDGNLNEAFKYHPLFFLPIVLIIILIYNKIRINRYIINDKIIMICIIIILAVYIFRMVTLFPKVAPMDINYQAIIPRVIKIISKMHF